MSDDETNVEYESDDWMMRESEPTWLEKYWQWKKTDVSDNIQIQASSNIPDTLEKENGLKKSSILQRRTLIGRKVKLRSRKVVTLTPVTIPELVKEESFNKDQFAMKLRASHGLGIEWKVTNQLRVFVNNFYLIETQPGEYKIGPGQACGLIQIGDELITINQEKLAKIHHVTTLSNLIRSIDHLAQKEVALTFRYGDHDGSLVSKTTTEVSNSITSIPREQSTIIDDQKTTSLSSKIDEYFKKTNGDATHSDDRVLSDRELIEDRIIRNHRYPAVSTYRAIPFTITSSFDESLAIERLWRERQQEALAVQVWQERIGSYRNQYSQFFASIPLKLIQPPARLPLYPDHMMITRAKSAGSTSSSSSSNSDLLEYRQWQQCFENLCDRLAALPTPSASTSTSGLQHPIFKGILSLYHAARSLESRSLSDDPTNGRRKSYQISHLLPSHHTSNTSNSNEVKRIQRGSPLSQDPQITRIFRHHIIPLHHEAIKSLLSLPSEKLFTRLIQQIEELRFELEQKKLLLLTTSSLDETDLETDIERNDIENNNRDDGIDSHDPIMDSSSSNRAKETTGEEEDFLENDQLTSLVRSIVNFPSFFSHSNSNRPPLGSGAPITTTTTTTSLPPAIPTSTRLRSDSNASLASTHSTYSKVSTRTTRTRLSSLPSNATTSNNTREVQTALSQLLPRATQYETNYSFFLPPFLITYSLLYAIYHLREVVLTKEYRLFFYKVLSKWLALVPVEQLEELKRRLFRSKAWSGSNCQGSFDSSHRREEQVELRKYLEVISDLVTFYVFLKVDLLEELEVMQRPILPEERQKKKKRQSFPPPPHPSGSNHNHNRGASKPPPLAATTTATTIDQESLHYHARHFYYLPFELPLSSASRASNRSSNRTNNHSIRNSMVSSTDSEEIMQTWREEESPENPSEPIDRAEEEEAEAEEEDWDYDQQDELDEQLAAFILQYHSILNVDMILAIAIKYQWKHGLTAILEKMMDVLGVDWEDLGTALAKYHSEKLAAASSLTPTTNTHNSNSTLSSHSVTMTMMISPKKRLFSPQKVATGGLPGGGVNRSPFTVHRDNPAFQSPPPLTAKTGVVYHKPNLQLQQLLFELIRLTDASPDDALNGRSWLQAYSQLLLRRYYFCQESAVSLFAMLLPQLIQYQAKLSLELVVHHFHPLLSPFVMKYLLFNDHSHCLGYHRARRRPSCGKRLQLFSFQLILSTTTNHYSTTTGDSNVVQRSEEEEQELQLVLYYFEYLTKVIRHHYPTASNSNTTSTNTHLNTSTREKEEEETSLSGEWWRGEGSYLLYRPENHRQEVTNSNTSNYSSDPFSTPSSLYPKTEIAVVGEEELEDLLAEAMQESGLKECAKAFLSNDRTSNNSNSSSHSDQRRNLINEWLELSLLLSRTQTVTSAASSSSSSSSSSSQPSWQKMARACVKSIVNCDRDRSSFVFHCREAMQSCLMFEEYGGFLQIFRREINRLREVAVGAGEAFGPCYPTTSSSNRSKQKMRKMLPLLQVAICQLLVLWIEALREEEEPQQCFQLIEQLYRQIIDYLFLQTNNSSTNSDWIEVLVLPINAALVYLQRSSSSSSSLQREVEVGSLVCQPLKALLFDQLFPADAGRIAVTYPDLPDSTVMVQRILRLRRELITALSPSFLDYLSFEDYYQLRRETK